jgi:hypothetical protein
MNKNVLGKIYIALMSVYFVVSGFNALFDIDSKLARVGLSAIDFDGKIAFILIYCSLMIGVGVSIALLYYFSKTWEYSAILATIIISSFISFRLVGAYMLGDLSNKQLSFLGVELIEVAIGIFLINKSGKFNQQIA